MDTQDTFANYWSAQAPFTTLMALEQLRLWTTTSTWFKECDTSHWFEVDKTKLEQLQLDYQTECINLGNQLLNLQPFEFDDRRFKSENWNTPLFGSVAAFYLLNSKFMLALVDLLNIDDKKAAERLKFLIEQTIAASAPSNFLYTNPDALEKAIQTNGGSLLTGLMNLQQDMMEGKLRQCDKDDFEIGVSLATTPGEVVFQNEFFQLIQYAPAPKAKTQYEIPILIVPPAINKFYILDLQPHNSFIKHLVEQGHRVFLISWCNPDNSMANKTWEDYLQEGVITAMRVTRAISGVHDINLLGFCIGGTLLSCALSVLIGRGDSQPNSLTLFTCFLDYADTGPINVYVDEDLVDFQENTIGGKKGSVGLFRGEDMCNTFSILRPDELWWNYTTSKYLKGEKPRTFDILYWNNDSTNMPGPMYCWYLRHTYLQNDLKSGNLKCKGIPVDFKVINTPTYLYGSEKDHIVPWKSAYASTKLLSGDIRFVLGASGHVAGVINPPADNKRNYWTNDTLTDTPDDWLKKAERHEGSWWPDWFTWINQRAGKKTPVSKMLGSPEYPSIEPAPGSYVKK